jgi:hypothetical protein
MQSMMLSPWLGLTRAGNQLILSWPGTGFVVQENSNLAYPAGWRSGRGGAEMRCEPALVGAEAFNAVFLIAEFVESQYDSPDEGSDDSALSGTLAHAE